MSSIKKILAVTCTTVVVLGMGLVVQQTWASEDDPQDQPYYLNLSDEEEVTGEDEYMEEGQQMEEGEEAEGEAAYPETEGEEGDTAQ